jgi:hypothetical protein
MSVAADPEDLEKLALAELTQLGLSLARGLHAQALAAASASDAAGLALAFHRTSRSVRQSIALSAKLRRDANLKDRADRADAERAAASAVQRKRAQVRLAVDRAIWDEAEGDEAERLADGLEDALEAAVLNDDFAATPVAALIAAIRAELGLSAASAPPEAYPETPPGRPDWRGSG